MNAENLALQERKCLTGFPVRVSCNSTIELKLEVFDISLTYHKSFLSFSGGLLNTVVHWQQKSSRRKKEDILQLHIKDLAVACCNETKYLLISFPFLFPFLFNGGFLTTVLRWRQKSLRRKKEDILQLPYKDMM